MLKNKAKSIEMYKACAFLAHCSSFEATQWLKDRKVTYSTVTGVPVTFDDTHLQEYILIRRKDPAINVALAEHGRSASVLQRLWHEGDAIRTILCGNTSTFYGDLFVWNANVRHVRPPNIIIDGTPSQILALCANPHMNSNFYRSVSGALIDPDAKLTEQQKLLIIKGFSANKRNNIGRDESNERNYLDGFAELEYDEYFLNLWKLPSIAPVTNAWASAMAELFIKFHVPHSGCIGDVEAILERWADRPSEGESARPSYAFQYLRSAIARHFIKPTIDELEHDDLARVFAALETFDPSKREFEDLDLEDVLQRDGFAYYHLMQNENVIRNAEWRSRARSAILETCGTDLTKVGFFDDHVELMQQQHPDWFGSRQNDKDRNRDDIPATATMVSALRNDLRTAIAANATSAYSAAYLAGAGLIGLVIGAVLF